MKVPKIIDMCMGGNAYVIEEDDGTKCLVSYGKIIAVYASDSKEGWKMWRVYDFLTQTSKRHFEEFTFWLDACVNQNYLTFDKLEGVA